MPAPDELRAEIANARESFRAGLATAASRWQTPGADGWAPAIIASHAIAADVFFASEVCRACGYPGLERTSPELTWEFRTSEGGGHRQIFLEQPCTDGPDGLARFEAGAAKADGRLKYVTEKDLGMVHERMGSVAEIMALAAHHLRDHAAMLEKG